MVGCARSVLQPVPWTLRTATQVFPMWAGRQNWRCVQTPGSPVEPGIETGPQIVRRSPSREKQA